MCGFLISKVSPGFFVFAAFNFDFDHFNSTICHLRLWL